MARKPAGREPGPLDPAQLTRALKQRVRELDCLYGISYLVEGAGGSLEQILQGTVELLPSSWEYPEITCARITFQGAAFTTANYRSGSPWTQTAEIFLKGERVGEVEVAYLEDRPQKDEGPFQAEERKLIDSIALRLGHIAERVLTEKTLQEREQELRSRLTHLSRVSTMGEMASSIAHEVNQPLTAIATYAQAARRLISQGQVTSGESLEILEKIAEEALRAGNIIHRLKDLIRKETGRRRECDINELIRSVENLAEVDARLHNVRLAMDLRGPLPSIYANCIQIQQVVLNLIRNGIDAMEATPPEHRRLLVATSPAEEGFVQVQVTDRGCGIAQEAAEALFQPFYTTKESGVGMGLSISRSIVTTHGGKLGFHPNPEGGSVFFFTLPTLPEVSHEAR